MGIRPLLQFPHPLGIGPVPLTLLFFPPSSFVLPSSTCFYILFSSGQVLLSALSWCSACTSVSEGAFLIYPWREKYYTSIYSSSILFSHVSFWSMVFSRYMSSRETVGSYGSSNFSFLGTSILFSIVATPIYIPINSVRWFTFLHILSRIYCLYTFW